VRKRLSEKSVPGQGAKLPACPGRTRLQTFFQRLARLENFKALLAGIRIPLPRGDCSSPENQRDEQNLYQSRQKTYQIAILEKSLTSPM